MNDTFFTVAMIACGTAGTLIYLAILIKRNKQDLRQYLEPPLRNCGVEFISATRPRRGILNTGPFPKIELQIGRPITNFFGIQGEYIQYRIVRFKEITGTIHDLWALVEFEAFKFRRVRWRTEHKDSLPEQILSLLEN